MQIRHNLVVPEKPFFRRGRCVLKTAHHVGEGENIGLFGMRRSRIGLALAGMAVCAVALAQLWPHARDAFAILAAQDDPAELADLRLNSALRNNPALVAENIEAALAAGDADLANSFVELARDKNIAARRRTVEARQRCRRGSKFDLAFCQALCHRSRHRQRRRCREPVGHGGRRSLRVRRYPRRGARRQASGDGRGYRPAGAGSCGRGPRGDGGDLCLGRRRGAGARRAHPGQGCPQGRAAGRGADAMGRPLGARGRRCADAAAGGRVRLGAAAGRRPSARSRRRSAPRRPARWFGSPRTSAASAKRPACAARSTRCASPKARRMSPAPRGLRNPRAARPARS